jgi:hypothetical protein
MHFHLPKPLHGWREFAGEAGHRDRRCYGRNHFPVVGARPDRSHPATQGWRGLGAGDDAGPTCRPTSSADASGETLIS